MSERKLEPSPGWCERAARALRAYRHIGDEGAEELYQEYEAASKPVPGRSGVVFGWDVPPNESGKVDSRLDPKPAPLPHEMVSSFICPECKSSHFGTDSTSEDKSRWIVYCHDQWHRGCRWKGAYLAHVTQPSPHAEKAEALPEGLPCVPEELGKFIEEEMTGDRWQTYRFARLLLAECRKIAREEADKVRPSLLDLIFDIAHGAARKELSKARLESRAGERWDSPRIVPGKEGE